MYLYGHIADDSKMRKTVLLTVESVVLTGVFVQTLKYATQRHRPILGTVLTPGMVSDFTAQNTASRLRYRGDHVS